MNSKVSIVIPFYKNIYWLLEAIKSVKKQTYTNIEIIIIDDGSGEDFMNIENKYNNEVIIFKQNNKGAAAARNKGIEMATGEYIAFLDSDDLWCQEKLSKQIEFMQKNSLEWCHCDYIQFRESFSFSKIIQCNISGYILPKCLVWNPIATPCVIIKSSILKEDINLRFNEKKIIGEDTHLWQELGKKYKLGYLPEALTKVRIHGTNVAYQAKLQLKHRANSFENIQKHKIFFKSKFIYYYLLSLLMYCKISCSILFLLEAKFNVREANLEVLSKFFYLIPYINFKIIKRII